MQKVTANCALSHKNKKKWSGVFCGFSSLHDALIVMQEKSMNLQYETSKLEERFDKAEKTSELTLFLAKKTDIYFTKTRAEPKQDATSFA